MKTIVLATGQEQVNIAISSFEDYKVLGIANEKKELQGICADMKPSILLIGEGLAGHEPMVQTIIGLGREFPHMRIIYLAGFVDKQNRARIQSLGTLVMVGIYDIIIEDRLNLQKLKYLLDIPKKYEEVSYLAEAANTQSKSDNSGAIRFDIPQDEDGGDDDYLCKNMFVVSSIKPGTGKSFLSTNLATAIAKFGVDSVSGERPRVALVEADLQNLSVGTLLGIDEDEKNLKSVIDKIKTVVKGDRISGTRQEIEETDRFILSCFKPYRECKNLETLVGSQLSFSELTDVRSEFYEYLINAIRSNFDVIIVDTNSSLMHTTTLPLLKMAKTCYYVINLDYNNIRNNFRYRETLQKIDVMDKTKYVLNEDIIDGETNFANSGLDLEKLMFDANALSNSGIPLEARIPVIPKTIFLNRLYSGTPIVLDNSQYTEKAKIEIMKVANQIWPIRNFAEMLEKAQAGKHKKKGLFR